MQHTKTFLPQGWDFVTDEETGRKYPVPAGGADDDTGEEVEGKEPDSELEDDDDDDDLENFNSETFLQSIEDEALRSQLEPHVKRWDAGVTRRFQDLHSRYRPYEDLGEVEQLQEAQQLYQLLNESPERVYQALAETFGANNTQQGVPGPQGQFPQGQQGQQQVPGADGLTQQQYAQLPPDIQKQIEQQSQIVSTLAEHYLQQEKSQEQAQEDAELDSYLDNLKTELGDFDEEYVLLKMSQGTDGAKAVKQWNRMIENQTAKRAGQNAPQVISGGGQVGQETFNVGEASSQDVKKLVAGLIQQAQGD